jgi:hypothetical protein
MMHKDQTYIKRSCSSIGIIPSKLQSGCYTVKGSAGQSMVAGDRVAAGTLSAGQTPVVSGSGEVERARRSTIDA